MIKYKKNKIKGESNLAIKLNENKDIVDTIKEGLKKTGGYCPCRTEKTEDTKCMCTEFKKQINFSL